jgi:hypothetical protein
MLPKHFTKRLDLTDTSNKANNRKRSDKRESSLAKELQGGTFINSGATFKQNDVFTDYCEIDDKTTSKNSFSLNTDLLETVKRKCDVAKIPIITVHFEEKNKTYAVIAWEDLKYLLER